MTGVLVRRIEERLKALGLSAEGASKNAGLGRDFIRTLKRRPDTSPQSDNLAKLASALECDIRYLLGEVSEVAPQKRRIVRLVGYVGAGAVAHYYEPAEMGEVDAPDNAGPDTVAVMVRGTSLGPLFDRWLVYYDEVRRPVTGDMIGRLCVVGLLNGKVLVKRLQRAKAEGTYHLESNTEPTMFDQEIEWAAAVKSMTPR